MSNRKVIILGANGQIGSDLVAVFRRRGWEVAGLTHQDIEIADAAAVEAKLATAAPQIVVNAAAFHNVEACETDPQSAFAVNALGARNLASASLRHGFRLIHISTDYVFDGRKRHPYTEEDCPRPLNCYANSKLSGELFIQAIARNFAVVRVCGLYGAAPCRAKKGLNFVKIMLKLARERGEVKVVTDEFVTPTYTLAAAEQIARLADAADTGLFHATPQGQCSWHEFAQAIFQYTGTAVKLLPATAADFPAKIPRPSYSVLDNRHLRDCGLDIMPAWQECLRGYLKETGELKEA
jgi:dTDP-4-dehydrorhamnose reductase